ncbi:hypothetical protein RUM43_014946 [Polyplax serrata]|uniref:Uncharacterized protein n=1 Tax=Polyplax serrata TaxID=468196 RepID=A0AAN8P3V5_POLSC
MKKGNVDNDNTNNKKEKTQKFDSPKNDELEEQQPFLDLDLLRRFLLRVSDYSTPSLDVGEFASGNSGPKDIY